MLSWTGDPWTKTNNLEDANLSTQYISSLYWAFVTLLTVGYGDMVPITNVEKGFAIVVIVLGAVFYAVVFGMPRTNMVECVTGLWGVWLRIEH